MGFEAKMRPGRILGICTIAIVLAGCGEGSTSSSSSDSASATDSSSGGSSSANLVSSGALVALSSSAYNVAPSSSAVVTIFRSGSSVGAATVGYTTIDGTATAGTDYVATSGTVTWDDGDSSAKTVIVPVTSQASGTYFDFALTSIAGQAKFGSPATAAVVVSTTTASTSSSSSGGSSSSSSSSGATSSTSAVTISWSAPIDNTNGTALTNLAGYNIYYGNSSTALSEKISLNTVGLLSYVISDLSSGTWYFAVTSVNSAGVESSPSATVSTTI